MDHHRCCVEELMRRFSSEVASLKDQACLVGGPLQCESQWNELASTVAGLEERLQEISQGLQEESRGEQALIELKERLEAERKELSELEQCRALCAASAPASDAKPRSGTSPRSRSPSPRRILQENGSQRHQTHQEQQKAKPRADQQATKGPPGRPVTDKELESLPSHQRGHHNAIKVNKDLSELLQIAQRNQELLKMSSNKVDVKQQEKHKKLTTALWTKDLQRKLVVLDSDIRGGPSWTTTMVILRNLGRVAQVREAKGGVKAWELM